MADWEHCPAVERAPAPDGGHWVFRGTDAPLYALYAMLAAGATVDHFAARFPAVSVAPAAAVLEYEADELHDFRLDYPQGVPFMQNAHRPPGGSRNAVWQTCPELWQVSGLLGGVWAFRNSRLALYVLFDNLAGGCTLAEFDEWYGMDAARAAAVLEHAAQALRTDAVAAYAHSASLWRSMPSRRGNRSIARS